MFGKVVNTPQARCLSLKSCTHWANNCSKSILERLINVKINVDRRCAGVYLLITLSGYGYSTSVLC